MRRFLVFLSLICLLFFSSCSPSSIETKYKDKNSNYKISDFFTFKGNFKISYQSLGNNYSSRTVYIDYIKGNRIQLRIVTPSTVTGQVIESDNGELKLLTLRDEFNYIDDLTSYVNKEPEILLKEPIKLGNSWTLPNGSKRFISGIDMDVETPIGRFKCLEVTTKSKDSTKIDYYALGFGPIKTIYKDNNSISETVIDKVENSSKLIQIIKFYYPDNSSNIIYIKNKEYFKTNDLLKDIIEKNFKSAPFNTLNLISDDTKINKLYFNYPEHTVYVDFSKDFLNWLKLNALYEKIILQSIINTLGDYFNTDKICITIEGNTFISSCFITNNSNIYYVDYKNIKEYK
ncbi:Sporulation and spore germination [Caloramator quimbayensis]|uniref:Sporulation and spore germination n=1 Tax=Caloramator quimbayensis TaxID=1147123 RepID=A0A1T4X5C0_9CLOT|nr:GerMN domain-containing protein [Caloramator quimbayensis]SKA84814.1 Sporulation and spore germination [Caloramator quimbayensis]